MNFEEAIGLIKSFWNEPNLPFGSKNFNEVIRLEKELNVELPAELRMYLSSYAPDLDYAFETVGNQISLYNPKNISSRLDGYSWNPVTSQKIDDWLPTWFLIGDQGADPIIVDLAIQSRSCPVFQSVHGVGIWDYSLVAHSIPLYMVLVAAQHHALTGFEKKMNAMTDNEKGFNLIEPAAKWYFLFLKKLIPDLYKYWTEGFDNA